MKENDILRSRFKAAGHTTISELVRAINSKVTQETWGKVLNRDGKASLDVLLKMSSELGCPPEEIKQLLEARGETRIAKLIVPTALSGDDQRFLDKMHTLKGDVTKLKLVNDLLDTLGR